MYVMTGVSYENKSSTVPSSPLSVTTTRRDVPTPAKDESHKMEVAECHIVEAHRVLPMRRLGVALVAPKLVPSSVILAPPDVGVFGTIARDRTGALYENIPSWVPTIVPSVSVTRWLRPVPACAEHPSAVAEIHEIVEQTVPEIAMVGVESEVAKFSPNMLIEAVAVVGVLNGAENVTDGESNVNDESCVPIRVDTVKPTSIDEPYPSAMAHEIAELLSHAVVAHATELTAIEGVVSDSAKFKPVTVMLRPAVDAPFIGRSALMTGESYVKT
jgi:hypothetical protein